MKEDNKSDNKVEMLPPKLAKRVALFGRCNLSPFCGFWGGIVAQEIVKFTGKFMPIRPWFFYDTFHQVLPEDEAGIKREVVDNSRYRDQIALFGREIQARLEKLNLFMVGAGALGCEYMKQFALMGIGCNGGKVEVTDDDTIELSNLNRQFLFKRKHVGHSKSLTACQVAKAMNPQFNAIGLKNRVSPETESVFTDQFWDAKDFIVGAVDNVKAR